MTVENVTYISDLEPANPKGGDSIAQGDNHIRNTKLALKNTFPNVDGEVKPTDEELNHLVGVTQPIQDILDQGNTDLSSLEVRVTKNESDIASNAADIDANKQSIAFLDAQRQDHDARINKNAADIAQIDQDMSSISGDISSLQSQVNLNTQSISNNTSAISGKADKSYVDSQDQALSDRITALESKGGAMIKVVAQPSTAGSFSLFVEDNSTGNFVQKYVADMSSGSTSTYTLSVPNGRKFCLEGIFIRTSGTCRLQAGKIIIDGVDINGGSTGTLEYTASGGKAWPSPNSAPIEVSSSLQLQDVYAGGVAPHQLEVAGFFVEA